MNQVSFLAFGDDALSLKRKSSAYAGTMVEISKYCSKTFFHPCKSQCSRINQKVNFISQCNILTLRRQDGRISEVASRTGMPVPKSSARRSF